MSNEIYTDLENEYYKEKHETLRMEVIKMLIEQYPNDADLGKAIREFVGLEKNQN